MALGRDQSDELSVTMEAYLLNEMDHPLVENQIDCTIRVFQLFGSWIMQSYTSQKYRAAIHFYILYLNTILSVISLIGVALIQHEKCYTSWEV